jgi:hypothetical protein
VSVPSGHELPGHELPGHELPFLPDSRGRRDPYPFDDRAVSLIVTQEVVSGIALDPHQQWGVFTNALLEQGKRLLTIAQLGMDQGQINWRDIAGPGLTLKLIQLPVKRRFSAAKTKGALEGSR